MERFKQQKSIEKFPIEDKNDSFVKTTKEFKKLDEVCDADERIKTKKNKFESWSTMVFMRGLDKKKYWELVHDFSIQYAV